MYKQASVCLIGILLLTVSLSNSSRAQAPQGLEAKPGNEKVKLEWDYPNDDNIVSYAFRFWSYDEETGRNHDQVYKGIPESDKNTTTYTVSRLYNDLEYGFRICAVYENVVCDKDAPGFVESGPAYATPTSTSVLPPDKAEEQDSPPDRANEQDSPPDRANEQDSPPDRANEQDSPPDRANEQDSPLPMNDSGSSGGCALIGVGVGGEGEEGAGFLAILFLLALIPSVRIYRSRLGGSSSPLL